MRLVTVVSLLLLPIVVSSTVAAFRPVYLDTPDAYVEEETSEDKQVSECFGKLRAACSVNQEFSDTIDRYARTLRVDKLREIIERKVQAICNQEEKEAMIPLLRDELSHSATIVKELVHKLSDFDRDRLNMWANLNDTLSERNFYLDRIRNLPPADIESLTNSLNTIISRLVNGEAPACITELIESMSTEDRQQLTARTLSFEHRISDLLERIGMPTDNEDLRLFIAGTFRKSETTEF
ncbi:hypothetical protein PRIPAC_91950 [Pristionchus pacificus]|uniref:Uncharacterized protein n=1 Tax=Pristionchus pacificus TaxID=54126 RepID=A0A2A6BPZ8_PRIPA|nr:hypothetical protein PRIPAC_91950 [Pristionchus pacificus]|eukprot:PDM67906.1 hypothetical protein PRIPAC_45950 [Pristionchus pacificus]